jgi:hypothetical protein
MLCASVVVLACLALSLALAAPPAYDIVIYGATPAGIAAAIAADVAAHGALQIALITPDPFIGGMVSAGGIGLCDIGDISTILNTSLPYVWAMLNAEHYGVSYPVWQPDNYVGNSSFWALLNQHSDNVHVFLNEPLIFADGSVVKSGNVIQAIATGISGDLSDATWWNASVFIDASYDADLVLQSGCSWTYGREANTTYGESYAGVQPYTTFGQFLVETAPQYPNGILNSIVFYYY